MERLLPAICLTLLLFAWSGSAQVPPVACPEYFQYLAYNQEYVGRVSVRHDPQYAENTLRIQFSQRASLTSNYIGSLTLWDDEETTKFNLRFGNPVEYRVDFPTPGVVPKLTHLMINDVVLCAASPYPPSSVSLTLSHSLRPTSTPLFPKQISQQNPQRIPQQVPPRTIIRPQQPIVRVPTLPASTPQPNRIPTTQAKPPPAAPSTIGQGLLQLSGVCGREGPVAAPLIHHGTEVRRGQLPWIVALFERNADGPNFFCGGTLISALTVLSAAHCFRFNGRNVPASRAAVSLGRVSLDLVSDGLLLPVTDLVIPDEYSSQNYTDADIALLRLEVRVSFGEYVKPICLWNENFLLDLPSGYKSYVAGWGADENGNVNTRVAKMTDTDIVLESECRSNLRSQEGVRLVTSKTLCASNKQAAGPCNGDSGGGLMIQQNNIWLLRGIVSAGQTFTNRCDLTQPVIYTDLARHISWLRQKIWV